ncbi:MAG: GTP-binding protein [Oculatellaceae cyanobacterium Prado106]|nr:GTP-binding protein [Oculatellaceae cyanobacterium Prado106]
MVIQSVGNRFDTFYNRPWQLDEPRQTRLVFVGQSINLKQFSASVQEEIHISVSTAIFRLF